MRGLVLLPEQEERHALALELAVHVCPVGQAAALGGQSRLRRGERSFQRRVVELGRVGHAGQSRSRQIIADGALTNATLAAICRWLLPAACSRRTSRILRMDILAVGTGSLSQVVEKANGTRVVLRRFAQRPVK